MGKRGGFKREFRLQRSSELVIPIDGAPCLTEGGNIIAQLHLLSILLFDQIDNFVVFRVEVTHKFSMISFESISFDISIFLQVLEYISTLCNQIL